MSDFHSRYRNTPTLECSSGTAGGDIWKRYYEDLSVGERATMLLWARMYLRPIKTTNWHCDCAVIKELFEGSSDGFKVTVDMVRGALLESGYTPHDHRRKLWYYNVGQRGLNAMKKELSKGV